MNYEQALDAQWTELRALLRRKHRKYGTENLLLHGEYGIMVRLDDKMARLGYMLDHPDEAADDETIEDTLRDVAGYAIAWLMLRDGTLTLPMKEVTP